MNAIRKEIKRLRLQRVKFLSLATKLGYSFTHQYTHSACRINLKKCDWNRFLHDSNFDELCANRVFHEGSGKDYYILSIQL